MSKYIGYFALQLRQQWYFRRTITQNTARHLTDQQSHALFCRTLTFQKKRFFRIRIIGKATNNPNTKIDNAFARKKGICDNYHLPLTSLHTHTHASHG